QHGESSWSTNKHDVFEFSLSMRRTESDQQCEASINRQEGWMANRRLDKMYVHLFLHLCILNSHQHCLGYFESRSPSFLPMN
ncbi:hypothetical protein EDD85DRAFT_778282, partial [Armillaria nabsnona]